MKLSNRPRACGPQHTHTHPQNKDRQTRVPRASINMYIYVRYINRGVASSTSHHKTSGNGRTFQSRPFSFSSFSPNFFLFCCCCSLLLFIFVQQQRSIVCIYIYHRYGPTDARPLSQILRSSQESQMMSFGPFGLRQGRAHSQTISHSQLVQRLALRANTNTYGSPHSNKSTIF